MTAGSEVEQVSQPQAARCHRWRSVAILCTVGFAAVALFMLLGVSNQLDHAALEYIGRIRTSDRTNWMIAVSLLGWGNVEIPLALALAGWLWYRRRPACARFYVATTLSGWAVYALLKASFQRPRPSIIARLDGAGWWAFPSGHAMLAPIVFVLAAILLSEALACRRRSAALMAAAWIIVASIGFSRVYLGVHYPTDVLAGLLAGTAWVSAALSLRRRAWASPPTEQGSVHRAGATSNAASASKL